MFISPVHLGASGPRLRGGQSGARRSGVSCAGLVGAVVALGPVADRNRSARFGSLFGLVGAALAQPPDDRRCGAAVDHDALVSARNKNAALHFVE